MDGIIQGFREKINLLLGDGRTFVSLVLVLVALIAFGLGRQSVGEVGPESQAEAIRSVPAEAKTGTPETAATIEELPSMFYVGSKNGTVYHLPHCSGAKRIKEENKITFDTKEEAEAAGYRPAANCKGI